jgi:hypothetical protein
MRYFQRAWTRHVRLSDRLSHIRKGLAVLGVAAAAGVVCHDQMDLDLEAVRHVFAISAAVFPALALIFGSYTETLGLEEQAKNSRRMALIFKRGLMVLSTARGGSKVRLNLLSGLAAEAMFENANWLSLRRSRPASLPS